MRGVIEFDPICSTCGHRESEHLNGRINTKCTERFCHCGKFTPKESKALIAGDLVPVNFIFEG